MTTKKIDRRIARTRQMIRDAFTQLIEEKGFEAITISDLTEKADINRGTFYLHYKDKYDLFEQSKEVFFSELERIVGDAWDIVNEEYQKNMQVELPFSFIIKLFEFLKENFVFMSVILGSNGDPSIQSGLKEIIEKKMYQNFFQYVIEENRMVPLDYLFAYVSSAHLGVIQYWLKSGMEKTPQEMAQILSQITFWGPVKAGGLSFSKSET
ncbi:TetR/AcrR family transcriptional regulator [Psychrobacillus glaciei]|uniref:TetR/AcrR family transcriptional regulator n=1 Tax=Psychrobacillus glaciei TaxID=2283160 RepID=A0A5J6SIV2_9BACI|nr:TetR/AcrR family transcriptional regulator [Psychrobacillus glaciei]QFF97791.1 TetR/AcrR family transcriptional regulator [Psychrobacillus glaciei]